MSLNKSNKKWYCSTCIDPDVVNTPYILTQEELASISLRCENCKETYITSHKTILLEYREGFLCENCSARAR